MKNFQLRGKKVEMKNQLRNTFKLDYLCFYQQFVIFVVVVILEENDLVVRSIIIVVRERPAAMNAVTGVVYILV